jgi:hypothetical protein
MNKNTKTLLGVAVVAGLGYYLYTQYGKKSAASAGFANFAVIKEKCRCHKEKLGDVYLCGDGESLSYQSGGKCRGTGTARAEQ